MNWFFVKNISIYITERVKTEIDKIRDINKIWMCT